MPKSGPVLEFFSDSRIALSKEALNHPELMQALGTYAADDFEGKLGETGAYCGIVIDGVYTQEELDLICHDLTIALRSKRKIILT